MNEAVIEEVELVEAGPAGEGPTFADFQARMRQVDPFGSNRVIPAAWARADVPAIHAAARARLRELAGQALAERRGIGALLWSDPGVGKSHVLADLQGWADGEAKPGVFVYLTNLQAAPERLPRALLRGVVGYLLQGTTPLRAPLCRLLNDLVKAYRGPGAGKVNETWLRREHARRVQALAGEGPVLAALVDPVVHQVLLSFYVSLARRFHGKGDDGAAGAAATWLRGDSLAAEQARLLGLPHTAGSEGEIALEDDERIKGVLVALAMLASLNRQAFVLALDQVDNLEETQAAALSRFLHALLDAAPGLLLVTSGVRATLLKWKAAGVFTESTWNRIAQHEIELQRIDSRQAREIVRRRLEEFRAPFLNVVQEAAADDGMFPLGEAWAVQTLDEQLDLRPRDVLGWASQGWRRLQGEETGSATDDPVGAYLRQRLEEAREKFAGVPLDADRLAGVVRNLLRCLGGRPGWERLREVRFAEPVKSGPKQPFHLFVRRVDEAGAESEVGIAFLTTITRSGHSWFLKGLRNQERMPDRVVVATGGKVGLNPGPKGQEYFRELSQRLNGEFVHHDLAEEEVLELQALEALLQAARRGDLEWVPPTGPLQRLEEEAVAGFFLKEGRAARCPFLGLAGGG